jgi:hypothetical protein
MGSPTRAVPPGSPRRETFRFTSATIRGTIAIAILSFAVSSTESSPTRRPARYRRARMPSPAAPAITVAGIAPSTRSGPNSAAYCSGVSTAVSAVAGSVVLFVGGVSLVGRVLRRRVRPRASRASPTPPRPRPACRPCPSLPSCRYSVHPAVYTERRSDSRLRAASVSSPDCRGFGRTSFPRRASHQSDGRPLRIRRRLDRGLLRCDQPVTSAENLTAGGSFPPGC